MRDKRIKVIYFSLGGSEVRYIELSWGKIFLLASVFLVFITFLVGSTIGLFTDKYHNFRVKSLGLTNMTLTEQLKEIKKEVVRYREKMIKLEKNDDEERIVAGLDKIDKDIREVGVGGTAYRYINESSLISFDTKRDIQATRTIIDQLERRVQLLIESKEEIEQKLKSDQLQLKHTPSIRPVDGGRITDTFGMRLDPFVEQIRKHCGIDIAAQMGTPVFAAAAGIINLVNNEVSPKGSYGKEVVIDHGNGLKTRYAHLSEIHVKVGQKVNRWDRIGSVGRTGRATGPHLHYEVIVDAQTVDPLLYILE